MNPPKRHQVSFSLEFKQLIFVRGRTSVRGGGLLWDNKRGDCQLVPRLRGKIRARKKKVSKHSFSFSHEGSSDVAEVKRKKKRFYQDSCQDATGFQFFESVRSNNVQKSIQ